MRIGIVAIMSTLGGPKVTIINILKEISMIDRKNEYYVFTDIAKEIPLLPNIRPVQIELPSPYRIIFWDHIKLPFHTFVHSVDVIHHTKNVVPILTLCKTVVTIPDMAPFIFPESFSKLQCMHLQLHIKHAVKHASVIITCSELSRKDIIRLTGADEKKIRLVYSGRSEIYQPVLDSYILDEFRMKKRLPRNFILYVGTIQPRKNIDIIIRAFNELKKNKKIPQHLLIVGRQGWLANDLDKLVKELNLENFVHFTGVVPEEDLPIYYNLADIFVSPSSYEGFGLTPIEAMACGLPVITSNISAIPEIVGDAAILVEPRNVKELAHAMDQFLSNVKLREEYSMRGMERSKLFTWDKTARQMIEIYEELNNK